MARNHEVTKEQDLLNEHGEIAEPGWSRKQVWKYQRRQIKANPLRIKEWDYYLILSDTFGIALTISDDGYIGMQSATLLKFDETPLEHTETVLDLFPMGKMHLPESSSSGKTSFHNKRLQMDFEVLHHKRHLTCLFHDFYEGKDLAADIILEQPDMNTLVIATPWDQKHAFYYNQKINCMKASGSVTYDGKTYAFDPEKDYGTLDWGRGVWTYDNTWYWGSGNQKIDGHDFGFNIGYGFGNTTAATENVLFYDGEAHKLDEVKFNIPYDKGPNPFETKGRQIKPEEAGSMDLPAYTEPWTITSTDHRFDMLFTPILDRSAKIDLKFLSTDQHQVFGKMNGIAVLDDGTKIQIKDLLCFGEKVHNRY